MIFRWNKLDTSQQASQNESMGERLGIQVANVLAGVSEWKQGRQLSMQGADCPSDFNAARAVHRIS